MTIHVIGAGLAGLAAAIRARHGNADVSVHEAASVAGGRCRSWDDAGLGAVIDNGAHVLVGANRATRAFLTRIGSEASIAWLDDGFEILDPDRGHRHRFAGPVEVVAAMRGSRRPMREMLQLARLMAGNDSTTVDAALDRASPLARILWAPLAKAVMNLAPEHAAAGPFARTLRRTVLRGATAMRIGVARDSLASSFVEPALGHLADAGVGVRLGSRLRALERSGSEIRALAFDDGVIGLRQTDRVILAIPPWELSRLLPDVAPSHRTSAIINLHARLDIAHASTPPRLVGLIGREVEWILQRGALLCAGMSAADRWVDSDPAELSVRLWREAAEALGLSAGPPLPPLRLVKERRATPAQTPEFEARRPGPMTPFAPVLIAGDWVQPGLPCTIESAIASGIAAAERALESTS